MGMARKLMAVAATAAILVLGARAEAGVYTDDLSRCMVNSSTAEDHVVLVQWMFAAFTLHPALQSMSTLTAEQRDGFNKQVAALSERLMYTDCRAQLVAALKYEGTGAITAGFGVLGAVATRDLFGEPHVVNGMSGLDSYFDKAKQSALYKEAGVPEPKAP
jgi:hypothetical protein